MATVLWNEIYDPGENEAHMTVRWVSDPLGSSGHWAYYEPYGSKCQEKRNFQESINKDHPLWTKTENNTEQDGNPIHSRDAPARIKRGVHFNELGTVSDRHQQKSFKIDAGDRKDRVSWITSNMLAEFVEKCPSSRRDRFFDYGGIGRKFVKDKEMMKKILHRLSGIEEKVVEDSSYKIALSDITVKDYPRHYFHYVLECLRKYKERGSQLNSEAKEFVPNSVHSEIPCLPRTGPKKICGAYAIDPRPVKPQGFPKGRRPKSSGNNSREKLFWAMKSESDKKIEDLDRKLDLLIQMGGPVVTAEEI